MPALRRRAAPPRCGSKVHWPCRMRPILSVSICLAPELALKKEPVFANSLDPVIDDLLPGMLHLARDGGETLTRQLTEQLRRLITKGRLAPGQRLPSSPELAQSMGLSRNTASFAIEQLAAEGYVTLSAGRRPVVAEGLSLDRRKLSRSSRSGGARISLSAWASSLQRSVWPPIHKERPRPFQPGLADEREFPHDEWSRCLRRAARNTPLRRDRPINHPSLQEALLRHLAVHRGVKAAASQILFVPRRKLAWRWSPMRCSNRATTPGSKARATAAPTSHFRPLAHRLRHPARPQGMAISSHKETPRLIFVTPSHQYPTGRLMPIGRRLELLRFAEAAGACIIEDDYDGEFHYEARPVAALHGLAPSPAYSISGLFRRRRIRTFASAISSCRKR